MAAASPAYRAHPNSQTVATERIGLLNLLRVLWRSFFLQASTNYERMQNVGFAFCILPALTCLYKGDALKQAMARHLEFFNSHPYMAASLLGATARLEEDICAGTAQPDEVRSFKTCMMGPMAAIGDTFFWASLKPFAASLAAVGVLAGVTWAPFVFLALYNLFHLTLRIYGLVGGYRLRQQVVESLYQINLVRFSDRSHHLAALCVGFCVPFIVRLGATEANGLDIINGLSLVVALALIFYQCLKRKIPMLWLLYGASGLTFILILSLNSAFPLL